MLKKIIFSVLFLSVLATSLIGFAHTKSGSFLKPYIPGMSGGCPIGAELPLSELDTVRDSLLKKILGKDPLNEMQFLGFDLLKDKKEDVLAWIKSKHLTHVDDQKKNQIYVRLFDASSLKQKPDLIDGKINEVLFIFSATQDLISVVLNQSFSQKEAASSYFQNRKKALLEKYPTPFIQKGEGSVQDLSVPYMNQSIEYRFSNARISMNIHQLKENKYNLNEYIQRPAKLN
jgi:hypothetical protein